MRPQCPRCGLRLDRGEEDYWLGAMLFNLIAAEVLFGVGVLLVLMLAWPDPPWDALLWGGMVVMIVFPIFTYPLTKLLWLAFDMQFRPLRPEDFAGAAPDEGLSAGPPTRPAPR